MTGDRHRSEELFQEVFLTMWEKRGESRTVFYGAGPSGDIEATALAALAFLKAGGKLALVRSSLAWLVSQKDPQGAWRSTQATVLALKAIVEGTAAPVGGDEERRIEITLNDNPVQTLVIPADQAEVMKLVDLSNLLEPGVQRIGLNEVSRTGAGYQVTFAYHIEEDAKESPAGDLAIDVAYDRTRLTVDETVTAVAKIVNRRDEPAPMVIVDLPIPGGCTLERGELDKLVGDGKIAWYQLTPRQAIVYLRSLEPGETQELRYRLRATMPVKVQVPAAQVYEYYKPENRGQSQPAELESVEA